MEDFAMPLQRDEVLGYDFNRMVVDFTMLNQGKTVKCAISTAAMDDLEGKRDVRPLFNYFAQPHKIWRR